MDYLLSREYTSLDVAILRELGRSRYIVIFSTDNVRILLLQDGTSVSDNFLTLIALLSF